MSRVLCIIQARMGSKRLPGKMLMQVGGETLIERAWRTACEAFGEENVVVAIPATEENLPILEKLLGIGATPFIDMADESNVLSRMYACADFYRRVWGEYDLIFRVTPDDWRKDPEAMRRVAKGEKGIPVEIGGECCTLAQLKEWHETVTDPTLREHIGHLITPNPVSPPDDGFPWSVDTEEDYRRACESVAVSA